MGKKEIAGWTAIEGWSVTYFEPTYGMVTYRVTGHTAVADLKSDIESFDAQGIMYRIKEIAKAS